MGSALGGLASPEPLDLADLAGERVVIDGHLDLHQYLTAITDDWNDYVRNDDAFPISHLLGIGSRMGPVLEAGIKPIYVFDGGFPEIKEEEVESRRNPEAAEKFREAKANGEKEKARKLAYQKVAVTDTIVSSATSLLTSMGIPVVKAPAEGEPQCVQFVHEGQAEHVATEDWDALLYGPDSMLRSWGASGTEQVTLEDVLTDQDWTLDELRWYAILRGTDYNSSVSGVGPVRGQRIVDDADSFEDVIEAAESWGEVDRDRWWRTLETIENPRVQTDLDPEWQYFHIENVKAVACDDYDIGESQVESWFSTTEMELEA